MKHGEMLENMEAGLGLTHHYEDAPIRLTKIVWAMYLRDLRRSASPVRNQCDGCVRGLPLVDGVHRGDGYDFICCTADRYAAQPEAHG